MKAELTLKGGSQKKIFAFEGETVQELIENNFDKLQKTIRDTGGNAAGFDIERAWIERIDENICEFHVEVHGSEHLIGYDAREEEIVDVTFEITGIPANEFEGTYVFEIKESEMPNPFKEKLDDVSKALGIFEACIDYIYKQEKRNERANCLTLKIELTHPNIKKTRLLHYAVMMVKEFEASCTVAKRKKKNKDVMELLDKAIDALTMFIEKGEKATGLERFYYHRAMYFLNRMNKITALKYYRKASGKTQKEVAEYVGMSLRQYQRYEAIDSALGDAKKAVVEKIAECIGVDAKKIVHQSLVQYMDEK